MLSQVLFLFAGMLLLTNASFKCTRRVQLRPMFTNTEGDLLVLCDNGRKIYVRKLPSRVLLIIVHNCKGNFNKFKLVALKRFRCRNGLKRIVYPANERMGLSSFSSAYSQLWEWY